MENSIIEFVKNVCRGVRNILKFDVYGALISIGLCSKNDYGKIRKLKDFHKGKKCFIIGSGPSLTFDDLTAIKNSEQFVSITCNSVFKAYEFTDWRADIYCVGDDGVWDTVGDRIIELHKDIPILVVDTIYNRQSKETQNALIPAKVRNNVDYPKRRHFSNNASKFVYKFGSVLYFMIQMAVYMGFDEIYLLGCDCNYSYTKNEDGSLEKTSDKDYFIPGYEDRKGHQPINQFNIVMPDYDEARRFCDAHGIKIYNATRGGKLESFERVNMDELFIK